MLVDRGPALSPDSTPYRTIGPFTLDTIPQGLLREHRLKPETWGVLRISAGSIGFRWDDAKGGLRRLDQGQALLVPPQVPHHLEPDGEVSLAIEFWA